MCLHLKKIKRAIKSREVELYGCALSNVGLKELKEKLKKKKQQII